VLAGLLALSVAFVATGGGVVDTLAAFGQRPSGSVLGAVSNTPMPTAARTITAAPTPTATPTATATATAARAPLALDLLAGADPAAIFVTESTAVLCAASAVQMTVEMLTRTVDRTSATQRRIHALEISLTTPTDSHNGGTGPVGMAGAITRLSGVPYQLRIASTRTGALRDAAATIVRTRHPVVLLAWRGAHAWVMTGFRANADPAIFADAAVEGAFILDPWYPRVSRIWGPSDPPNTFQDAKEMVRNYLPWKRPEGAYPGRDGRFLYLAPVETAG
jgi:hypothetical protein